VSSYASTTCQESKLQQRQYFGTGCAPSVQDTYYLDPSTAYSTSLQCCARSKKNNVDVMEPPVPVTNVPMDYVMQRYGYVVLFHFPFYVFTDVLFTIGDRNP